MPDINAAYRWAINTCNAVNPYAGYDMNHRYQEQIGNIVYYDCSSFIWYALVDGGGFILPSPAFATGGMRTALTDAGFTIIDNPGASTVTLPGDILVHNQGSANGHTEMVFAGGVGEARTMGAHGKSLPLADQVCINAGFVPVTQFGGYGAEFIARYGGGVAYQWHNKNTGAYDRSSVEAQENVMKMVEVLAPLGWTINAIAALCGNQAYESGFNPWRWENDTVNANGGYGLFQYTPAVYTAAHYDGYIGNPATINLTGYAPNYPMGAGGQDDGTAQLLAMDQDLLQKYGATSSYPLSLQQFKTSNQAPDYLASAWLYNFEKPRVPGATEAGRRADALWWYDWLVDHPYIDKHSSLLMLRRGWKIGRRRRGLT